MELTVSNLSFQHKDATTPIFDQLSVNVGGGEILSILGANGVGKSTLLRCIAGLLTPSSGEVRLKGQNITSMSFGQRARNLALVSQSESCTFNYRVLDVVLTGFAAQLGFLKKPGQSEISEAMHALTLLGIESFADRDYSKLSGGQQQLVRIARAVVQKSRVLLFDEPTAHLDLSFQLQVLKAIASLKEQGFTIVMTTHSPDHAHYCGGKVLLLMHQQFLYGSCQEMLTKENLKQLYQLDVEVFNSPMGSLICIPSYQK
ncbi:ABC transporter ATP-binding protein [Vibrio marisflavi]|uniref:ABC transporter ATP-binding protein n=1 Tax=Vibrio marisflavi CECT 7928 TaxID=634439 RepID=A0ABN8E9D0_9VIBR|nr:ABC transporter ATP-binding protein [Vibrio marisflavi]CAH0541940.1 putative ABC transporter ATP-binding protein [Vibrio marisflavi CECT 7928]